MSGFIAITGSSLLVFIGVTLIFMAGCAFMTGQALAITWRPWKQAILYGLPLGAADRFVGYALFKGQLLSWQGYIIDTVILIGVALLAYRLTRAHQMVTQYPWLYARTGLLSWRKRAQTIA